MDWDKLRIFHAVADAGSFTHAGDTLHLSQSAVSRQIRALEDELNVQIFERSGRQLTRITDAGASSLRSSRARRKHAGERRNRNRLSRSRPAAR